MVQASQGDRNQEATVYIGNLDDKVTESLLWELMLQVGPVVNVHIPKDRITQVHQNYGFCEFQTEQDADYAVLIMNMVKLYGKSIRVNKASADKRNIDIGATLFIGNLDIEVDEKFLYDTFCAFGPVIETKIARESEGGIPKGFGFVSFDNFESADAALESLNGQFLSNKAITVSYAFKKEGKGERHGSTAERLLAAQARKTQVVPNRLFGESVAPVSSSASSIQSNSSSASMNYTTPSNIYSTTTSFSTGLPTPPLLPFGFPPAGGPVVPPSMPYFPGYSAGFSYPPSSS